MGNFSKIIERDIANGTGIRVSIFFSGCTHHCFNCFNSELWDFNCGSQFTQSTIDSIISLLAPPYIKGLSILGGEPFQNENDVVKLCKAAKEKYPTKDIWVWTGYKFEEITDNPILQYADVIIDGKYEDDKRDLTLKFRGSSNQRRWNKENNTWKQID